MHKQTMEWFHQVMRDLQENGSVNFMLRFTIEKFNCEYYQRLSGKSYGMYLKLKMQIAPWEEMEIDLIGP